MFHHFIGFARSIMGGRCNTIWNSIFARCHTICGDVRSNGACAYFHDSCVRDHMQWRYIWRNCIDFVARHVWNVLWFCHICHLWIGTECHTTCPWLILSNTFIVRCDLAHWRNAICSKVSWLVISIENLIYFITSDNWSIIAISFQIYFLLFAINSSNNSIALHADTWLGYYGTGSLFRFYINISLDRCIFGNHNDRIEAETWLNVYSFRTNE